MSHLDFKTGVYYPKNGMSSLVSDMLRIAEKFDVTYHYNADVSKIITKNGKATGIVMNGEEISADIVVSNADLAFTETRLLDEASQTYPEKYWAKRQPGPSGLIISLGIKGRLANLNHHNLFFIDDWEENFESIYSDRKIPENTSIYVCNPSKTDQKLAPKNHENIFILIPLPAGLDLSEQATEELTDKSISILEKMTGESDIGSRVISKYILGPGQVKDRFNAWQNNIFGGESHILSQSIAFRTGNKSKKLSNLYYVGAGTLPGIGLPMCLISAEQTYKKIVNNKKAGRLSESDL